ncbi:hypothetical protein [Paenibacillus sp. IITD108]|uniref:hypothetical protein n=1 Tax=Paenibacillus sp. IITD108 TaxID=3116649 RepID=UPI002F40B61A
MKLVYDHSNELVRFGVEQIKKSLENRGIYYAEQYALYTAAPAPKKGIVVQLLAVRSGNGAAAADPKVLEQYEEQAFRLIRIGELYRIEAIDARGLMYGCLELAERLAMGKAMDEGEEIYRAPLLRMRGIKFNLPFAPFDSGDPFVQNEETCLDLEFWKSYIDMLALNRYNCLSLWSEHPYDIMVVSPKYRAANPYSDDEIKRNIALFRSIFRHAASRGIDIYLFTWNIRITKEVAKGLGLPDAVGDYGDMYSHLIHRTGVTFNRFRAESLLIQDYVREMVLQLLLTYPELKGLGTSASEWMDGSGYEREKWIVETYVEAIEQSGRAIPFIHRTNMQNAGKEIKELVQTRFNKDDFYISWKYSNAHGYSHPEPQFEQLWNAWEGIDLASTNVLYTVRNDDVFTHRWGDPDYVRSYVKGMAKPYVKGFYWGADGYVWAKDFQHIDYGHKTWRYDYERHLFQFQLWGRLAYDPDTQEKVWVYLLASMYGDEHAPIFLQALRSASAIIPAVNRLYWLDYDFQWHPESCLSEVTGFKTIIDFVNGKPMPGVGVQSIAEYAAQEKQGRFTTANLETPVSIISLLNTAADKTEMLATELTQQLGELSCSHSACTLYDLHAYAEMGRYYACKFSAALELHRFGQYGEQKYREQAVQQLENAVLHWEKLGYYWGLHNKPYFMARVKRMFGYPYYLNDVRADIELVRQYEGVQR